jgi:hypothetical protein
MLRLSLARIKEQALGALLIGNSRPIVGRQSRQHFGLQRDKSRGGGRAVVSVRSVDSVQYENRLRNWNFDIVVTGWEETLTPGNELRDYWGSRAAATPGSRNLIGIADKAVDLLIDRIVYATDRAEQVAATHALDRVLLWRHYVVPQWSFNKLRTARWNWLQNRMSCRLMACQPSRISGGGTRSFRGMRTACPDSRY